MTEKKIWHNPNKQAIWTILFQDIQRLRDSIVENYELNHSDLLMVLTVSDVLATFAEDICQLIKTEKRLNQNILENWETGISNLIEIETNHEIPKDMEKIIIKLRYLINEAIELDSAMPSVA